MAFYYSVKNEIFSNQKGTSICRGKSCVNRLVISRWTARAWREFAASIVGIREGATHLILPVLLIKLRIHQSGLRFEDGKNCTSCLQSVQNLCTPCFDFVFCLNSGHRRRPDVVCQAEFRSDISRDLHLTFLELSGLPREANVAGNTHWLYQLNIR